MRWYSAPETLRIQKMKLGRMLRVAAVGIVFASSTFVMSTAILFVRCLMEGVVFDFGVIWPIALRGSLVLGVATTILAAVGGPRQRL